MDWVNLMTTQNQLGAEMCVEILRDAGVEARVNPGDVISYLGISNRGCRVQVREDRRAEAEQVLRERGLWTD